MMGPMRPARSARRALARARRQGLRVVDAGAMPTITSGNTNSPVLMRRRRRPTGSCRTQAGRLTRVPYTLPLIG